MNKPLAEGWAEYSAKVLDADTPDDGREQLKTIFYAGAVCAFNTLTAAERGDIEAMKTAVDEIIEDMRDFTKGMRAKA